MSGDVDDPRIRAAAAEVVPLLTDLVRATLDHPEVRMTAVAILARTIAEDAARAIRGQAVAEDANLTASRARELVEPGMIADHLLLGMIEAGTARHPWIAESAQAIRDAIALRQEAHGA